MKTENRILIILDNKTNSKELATIIKDSLRQYNVEIIIAENALDGLIKFMQFVPCLIIADANLQTINGFSLSAIIKGAKNGDQCSIYMVVDELALPNSKIDYFIKKPINNDFLVLELKSFFEKRMMSIYHLDEINRAKQTQNELLPNNLQTDLFRVDYIYSPFNELSGDCLDYWYGNTENGLYGFLFDCQGHDICSFMQVSEVRTIFRWGFRCYQNQQKFKTTIKSTADIIENINKELFHSHGYNAPIVAAVAFYLDFKTNMLTYCSSGIPCFFIKDACSDQYKEIDMSNYAIGYEPDATFDEKKLSLKGIDEVIFSSDGFSELLFKNASSIESPKHDDVSAIFIQLS